MTRQMCKDVDVRWCGHYVVRELRHEYAERQYGVDYAVILIKDCPRGEREAAMRDKAPAT